MTEPRTPRTETGKRLAADPNFHDSGQDEECLYWSGDGACDCDMPSVILAIEDEAAALAAPEARVDVSDVVLGRCPCCSGAAPEPPADLVPVLTKLLHTEGCAPHDPTQDSWCYRTALVIASAPVFRDAISGAAPEPPADPEQVIFDSLDFGSTITSGAAPEPPGHPLCQCPGCRVGAAPEPPRADRHRFFHLVRHGDHEHAAEFWCDQGAE